MVNLGRVPMKRYIHIALLYLLLPYAASSQKSINIGVGILFIDYEKLPRLEFYVDTLQKSSAREVSIVRDYSGEYAVKNANQLTSWFMPEGLWLEYGIFVMRVDTQLGTWYKVFVNNETGTTLWTKADALKKFATWENFLLHETTAIEKGNFELEIKDAPDDNAKTIKNIESTDCFEAWEIRGDWLRVRTNDFLDCNQSKKRIDSGWIKWRHNNKLTVGYGLTC